MDAFRMVFGNIGFVILGIGAFLVASALYLWESQVIIVSSHGLALFIEPQFIAAALVLALLFGLLVPVEISAIRLAAASTAQAGGSVLGIVFGTASMTCCAPVLLPSILSLAGFSGTSILSINGALHRYWVPLATIGIILLSFSLYSATQALNLECQLIRIEDTDSSSSTNSRRMRSGS
jgi:cytochrome c biogenesis protein CcdA